MYHTLATICFIHTVAHSGAYEQKFSTTGIDNEIIVIRLSLLSSETVNMLDFPNPSV